MIFRNYFIVLSSLNNGIFQEKIHILQSGHCWKSFLRGKVFFQIFLKIVFLSISAFFVIETCWLLSFWDINIWFMYQGEKKGFCMKLDLVTWGEEKQYYY